MKHLGPCSRAGIVIVTLEPYPAARGVGTVVFNFVSLFLHVKDHYLAICVVVGVVAVEFLLVAHQS